MPEPLDLRNIRPLIEEKEILKLPAHRKWSPMHWWEHWTGEPMKRSEKVIGIILLIIFLLVFYVVLDANKYSMTVRVIAGEGRVGVNPTAELLDFGDLSRGTSALRRVDIQNGTPVPMWIAVMRVGRLSELMDLNKNYFVLKPRTGERIEFSVFMPASAEVDAVFTGRVFIFRIPIFWGGGEKEQVS